MPKLSPPTIFSDQNFPCMFHLCHMY
jgi:hypothetical protein